MKPEEVRTLIDEIMQGHTLSISLAKYDDFFKGHAEDIESEDDSVIALVVEVDGESDYSSDEIYELVDNLFEKIFTQHCQEMEGLYSVPREEYDLIKGVL